MCKCKWTYIVFLSVHLVLEYHGNNNPDNGEGTRKNIHPTTKQCNPKNIDFIL